MLRGIISQLSGTLLFRKIAPAFHETLKSSRSGLVIAVNRNAGPQTIKGEQTPEIGNIKPIRTALLHCRFWL